MVATRSKTVDYLTRQRLRRRKSFIDLSGKIRAEYQHHVSSEELDQPLVADPEVMRDLVEHDVPDLAA